VVAVATVVYLRFVVEPRKLRQYGDAYRRYQANTYLILPRIASQPGIPWISRRKRH